MAKALLVLSLAMLLGACALTPFAQSGHEARVTYCKEGFAGAFNGSAVAMLAAASGTYGTESRRLLGEFVEEALKSARPDIRIVPYWKTLSIINNGGLTKDYDEMLSRYSSSGILEKEALLRIGRAIGARYFLQPRLIDFRQGQSTRLSVLGLTLFKTHESHVKVHFELWDAETGEAVWIGAAEANLANEDLKSRPIPFEDTARHAVVDLVNKMP